MRRHAVSFFFRALAGLAGLAGLAFAPPLWAREVAHEYYQFKLVVPDGWEANEDIAVADIYTTQGRTPDMPLDGRVFVYFPKDLERSRVSVELIVKEPKFPVLYDARRERFLRRQHQDMFRELNPDLEVSGFRIVSDRPGNALRFEMLLPRSDGAIRQLRYLAPGRGFHYTLMLSAPAEDFEEWREPFEKIVASLDVLPPEFRAEAPVTAAQRWKRVVLPALAAALILGFVIRAIRTSRQLRKDG